MKKGAREIIPYSAFRMRSLFRSSFAFMFNWSQIKKYDNVATRKWVAIVGDMPSNIRMIVNTEWAPWLWVAEVKLYSHVSIRFYCHSLTIAINSLHILVEKRHFKFFLFWESHWSGMGSERCEKWSEGAFLLHAPHSKGKKRLNVIKRKEKSFFIKKENFPFHLCAPWVGKWLKREWGNLLSNVEAYAGTSACM